LSGASWPWLFAVNLPLGVLVLFASRALPHIRGTARRLDMLSVALNAGSFASFVIGAEVLPTRPALAVALLTMLCGLGFGLFQVPNNQNMFLAAPRERSGAAGGMQGTARLAGQTAGAIVMTLLFTLDLWMRRPGLVSESLRCWHWQRAL